MAALVEELDAGVDAAGVPREVDQQVELLRGQLELDIVQIDPPRLGVDTQRAALEFFRDPMAQFGGKPNGIAILAPREKQIAAVTSSKTEWTISTLSSKIVSNARQAKSLS